VEEKRPEEAIPRLRMLRAARPPRPDVAFNLVRAQLEAQHPDEANREAESDSKTFGNNADWSAAVGRAFEENGRPREAGEYLAAALRARPDSPEIQQQLAGVRLELKDGAGAMAALQAGSNNGKDPERHYLLASSYLLLHRLPEAETES